MDDAGTWYPLLLDSAEKPLVTCTAAIKNEGILPISMGLSAESYFDV